MKNVKNEKVDVIVQGKLNKNKGRRCAKVEGENTGAMCKVEKIDRK